MVDVIFFPCHSGSKEFFFTTTILPSSIVFLWPIYLLVQLYGLSLSLPLPFTHNACRLPSSLTEIHITRSVVIHILNFSDSGLCVNTLIAD